MIYMGSKSRIVKHIAPIIQKRINDTNAALYIEPFVGGGNVIDKIKCQTKIGYDINPYLIALLNRVKEGLPLLDSVPRELYNQCREEWKTKEIKSFEDWEVGNIGFLASYNGRFFDGGYARPQPTKDYYALAVNNILKQAQAEEFKNSIFAVKSYLSLDPNDFENAVFYLDPPYKNTKKYHYSKDFNYDAFWDFARRLGERNTVLISELEAPDDFKQIWSKPVSRTIKHTENIDSVEKLFCWEPK